MNFSSMRAAGQQGQHGRPMRSIAGISSGQQAVCGPLDVLCTSSLNLVGATTSLAIRSTIRMLNMEACQSLQAPKPLPRNVSVQAAAGTLSSGADASGWDGSGTWTRTKALYYTPKLPLWQDVLCLLTAATGCIGLYALFRPPAFSIVFSSAITLLFALLSTALRRSFLENFYRLIQRREEDLGCPDSKFLSIKGLPEDFKVHVKSYLGMDSEATSNGTAAASAPVLALHCYHGFGANLYSFKPVMKMLAAQMRAQVTAHDQPGFGLTTRPKSMSGYALRLTAALGRCIIDQELEYNRLVPKGAASATDNAAAASNAADGTVDPPSVHRVLIGHSLGGLCAALEALERPEGIAALVLISPAVISKPGRQYSTVQVLSQALPNTTNGNVPHVQTQRFVTFGEPFYAKGRHLTKKASSKRGALDFVAKEVKLVFAIAVFLILRVLNPFIVMLLRALVRSRQFWVNGLKQAYGDKDKLSAELVDMYRLPQLARGWEAGMCNFLEARMCTPLYPPGQPFVVTTPPSTSSTAYPSGSTDDMAERLASLVRERKVPVLLIHGTDDTLVPHANSSGLLQMFASDQCELVLFDKTGHMVHEEHPREFTALLKDFIRRRVTA